MKATMWLIAVVLACGWREGRSCNTRPRPGWPSFSQLLNNYPSYQSISWDGLVDQEGLPAWLKGVSDKNTCAMRVSRALTHAGRTIAPWSCVNWSGVRDSQSRPYIIRVATMRCYLEDQYGPADVTGSSESAFMGTRGIIVFQTCGFQAATGHGELLL
ncbi:uncharacterized protein [Branchiostoma lanceolatum]|uniref:uncharacterized protein n=1 Tax=Branchiostoma lanceolatum TaxID=7740 RepID=UPI0034524A4C